MEHKQRPKIALSTAPVEWKALMALSIVIGPFWSVCPVHTCALAVQATPYTVSSHTDMPLLSGVGT